jgi:hypothetical protein
MDQTFRDSWVATILFAAAAMLALMIVIVTVVDAVAMTATSVSDAPAYVHYQRADDALAAGDVVRALRHWQEGYAAAVGSRRWEGLVEAGDLYRRIGARGRFDGALRARECYLLALVRARGERSLDGVLRATEGFVDLGDAEPVQRGLEIARQLAAGDPDPHARDRVERLAARWAARTGRAGAGAPTETPR